MILFPSLLTPFVYVDGDEYPWFELVVASAIELTPDMVNRQLRISAGLDPNKPHSQAPLFGGPQGRIEVEADGTLSSTQERILRTHTRFSGVVHRRIAEQIVARGMTHVYRIKVHASALPTSSPTDSRDYARSARRRMDYRLRASDQTVVGVTRPALAGLEDSDQMIREILATLQPSSPIAGDGLYALQASGSSLDLMRADPHEPIQSYHPVFVFTGEDRFRYANLGHVSDIHVNSRLDLLGKTPARVIEYGAGQREDESPPISDLIMETNRSFHSVLHQVMGADCHALVVGGDLIDHIRNTYTTAMARQRTTPLTAGDIWHAVDLENNYSDATHPPGLDMIAFYSLVLRACRQHRKPVLALSGNHDCYLHPFGISPRILGRRANEGIPADLNLTFYEALLAFGPSSGMLRDTGNFKPEWLRWFYAVFTPFQDYSLKLPGQTLLCMSWGEEEDLIDIPAGDQGTGHLPRSDQGVSDIQYQLVTGAISDRERKVIMCSHYTFASYNDPEPMYTGGHAGAPADIAAGDYSRFEMGCYELHRPQMFGHLNNNEIQLVLTGHSHRRGVYLVERGAGATMRIRMYDPVPGRGLDLTTPPTGVRSEPAIVVSDSAGPYPKHNRSGEFGGWGPELPAGTLVRFDPASGAIANVRAVQGRRNQPRAAVGLDYMDLLQNEVFESVGIRSIPVLTSEHNRGSTGVLYKIRVPLHPHLHRDMRAHVTKVAFAGRRRDGAWIRVESTHWNATDNAWEIAAADNATFRDFINVSSGERFVVLYMGTRDPYLARRFNWGQPWIFEVLVSPRVTGFFTTSIEFRFARPVREIEMKWKNSSFAEVPNWQWRARSDPKYQVTPAS